MSLKPRALPPIPEETARVAQAAFPQQAPLLRLHDSLGPLYDDPLFADLFPARGQPAEAPWRLALVTVFQFVEDLSDRQAAQAVRSRIDWKYALRLELTDPGFDYSVLSEFRTRLLQGQAEERLLTVFLETAKQHGWVGAKGRQRTDSTHVVAAVRALNRLELVGETLRHALNVLAEVAPAWLRAWVPPEWYDRYSQRVEDYRLPPTKAGRERYAQVAGADGEDLLRRVDAAADWPWLRDLPAVALLRQVWDQQYRRQADGEAGEAGGVQWRSTEELPTPGDRVESPYDPAARFATKRATVWRGYKVHLTETCDAAGPHLITDVQTTPAPLPDVLMTQPIEQALVERDLLPAEHLVDAGYTEGAWAVDSQRQLGVSVVGPVRADGSWQAREEHGYDVTQFHLDWPHQQATCPQGHSSASWSSYQDRAGHAVVSVKFACRDCRTCPVRPQCTQSARGARQLTIRAHPDYYAALRRLRTEQATPEWKTRYNRRAGVEGTLSQGVRVMDLRQARYVGLAKVHLQHLVTAVALNLLRVANWLEDLPLASTRCSRFAQLALAS